MGKGRALALPPLEEGRPEGKITIIKINIEYRLLISNLREFKKDLKLKKSAAGRI